MRKKKEYPIVVSFADRIMEQRTVDFNEFWGNIEKEQEQEKASKKKERKKARKIKEQLAKNNE